VTQTRPLVLDDRSVAFMACEISLSFGQPFLAAIIEHGRSALMDRGSSLMGCGCSLVTGFESGHRTDPTGSRRKPR